MNGIPFGLMIYYAHKKKALSDQSAYIDLLNSWSSKTRTVLDKMTNLLTRSNYSNAGIVRKKRDVADWY